MKSLLLFSSLALFFAFGAQSQNACSSAYTISYGNHNARPSSGSGANGGGTHASWYSFTPAVDTGVKVSSCGVNPDTRLFIYTGTCGSLNMIFNRDDDCGNAEEEVIFNVTNGTTYYIEWTDTYDSSRFTWSLSIDSSLKNATGPTCATADLVSTGTHTAYPLTGSGANGSGTNAHWYRYVATANGSLIAASCSATSDTRLYMYSGTCGNLNTLVDQDDNCASAQEIDTIQVVSGNAYYVEWTDIYSSSPFSWTLSFVASGVGSQSSQTCATADSVGTGTYTATPNAGSGATGSGTNAHWYRYVAGANGSLIASSCGASSDTKLHMYSGTCSSLNSLVNQDDNCSAQERDTIQVTTGNTYFVEWTDLYSSTSFSWTLSFIASSTGPQAGETCALADSIGVGTHSASPNAGSGALGSGTNAHWYRYVATSNGSIVASSCAANTDTKLHMYSGSCSNLTSLINQDDNCGSQETDTIQVTSGNTYYIEWTDLNSNTAFNWDLSFIAPPRSPQAGETCALADLVGLGTHSASPDSGAGALGTGTNAHWFKYVASVTGQIAVSSCNAGNDTKLYVYDGSCGNLNALLDADNSCSAGLQESDTIAVTIGTSYYIEWTDQHSNASFNWNLSFVSSPTGPQAGELCALADSIGIGSHTASPDSGNGAIGSGTNSHWFKYVASANGSIVASSCGASSNTKLHMYAGTCSSLNENANQDNNCATQETDTISVSTGNTYYIEWTDLHSNTAFNWTLSFIPASAGPNPGETCAVADSIGVGTHTAIPDRGAGAQGSGTNAHWFKYVATANGEISVSSCNATSDTKLFVYDGTCNNLNGLLDADNSCSAGLQESDTIVVISGTTYYIEWTDEKSSASFDWELEFISPSTSIDDISEVFSSVLLFPNPTKSNVMVSGLKAAQTQVELFDMKSNLLESTFVNGGEHSIDLSEHAAGVYLIKLSSENEVARLRVIKR